MCSVGFLDSVDHRLEASISGKTRCKAHCFARRRGRRSSLYRRRRGRCRFGRARQGRRDCLRVSSNHAKERQKRVEVAKGPFFEGRGQCSPSQAEPKTKLKAKTYWSEMPDTFNQDPSTLPTKTSRTEQPPSQLVALLRNRRLLLEAP